MSSVMFFDPDYLTSYIQSGLKLQVFVRGMYLTVPDFEDLINDKKGVGYDNNGKPYMFDFRDIDHLKIGEITFTKDMLNKDDEEDPEGGEGEESSDNQEDDLDDLEQ